MRRGAPGCFVGRPTPVGRSQHARSREREAGIATASRRERRGRGPRANQAGRVSPSAALLPERGQVADDLCGEVVRMADTLESILALMEAGLAVDGLTLIRALYEATVKFMCLAIDPEANLSAWLQDADAAARKHHDETLDYGMELLTPEQRAAVQNAKSLPPAHRIVISRHRRLILSPTRRPMPECRTRRSVAVSACGRDAWTPTAVAVSRLPACVNLPRCRNAWESSS